MEMGIPVEIVGQSVDWPAWIQGIGSVVAILAGFGLAYWESRRSRAVDEAKTVNLQLAGLSLVETHRAALTAAESFLGQGKVPPPGILRMIEKQFESFPAYLLDDPSLYRLITSGWANVINVLALLETIDAHNADIKVVAKMVADIHKQAKEECLEYRNIVIKRRPSDLLLKAIRPAKGVEI